MRRSSVHGVVTTDGRLPEQSPGEEDGAFGFFSSMNPRGKPKTQQKKQIRGANRLSQKRTRRKTQADFSLCVSPNLSWACRGRTFLDANPRGETAQNR